MKNQLLAFVFILGSSSLVMAQENSQAEIDSLKKQTASVLKEIGVLKRLKLSGYIQPQFQYADSAGQPSFAGGNFAPGVNNRFMVRRGRAKIQYTGAANSKGISTSQYVLQFDVTERGIGIKDAYAKLTDPFKGWASVTFGQFNNPFGFEISYSSSNRESPERGRMSQLLFPNEREVGAMLTLQGSKNSGWQWLRIDAGLFNGNGAPGFGVDVSDFDKKKDFSGRIGVDRKTQSEKIKFGAGISAYSGGFRIDSVNVYKAGTDENGVKGFTIETLAIENGSSHINDRGFTKRNYFGVDAQFTLKTKIGSSTIRGEFITGDQPGLSASTKSPNDKNPITKDVYNREFNGAYFYFIQAIGKTPFEAVLKYDWYDPNTSVKGDEIGNAVSGSFKATNETDLRYDTFGFGLLYHYDSNVRIMAYYDMVSNEVSENLSEFTKDRDDNVFTLRMQVKF